MSLWFLRRIYDRFYPRGLFFRFPTLQQISLQQNTKEDYLGEQSECFKMQQKLTGKNLLAIIHSFVSKGMNRIL